jgi:hypothetical protein
MVTVTDVSTANMDKVIEITTRLIRFGVRLQGLYETRRSANSVKSSVKTVLEVNAATSS